MTLPGYTEPWMFDRVRHFSGRHYVPPRPSLVEIVDFADIPGGHCAAIYQKGTSYRFTLHIADERGVYVRRVRNHVWHGDERVAVRMAKRELRRQLQKGTPK